MPQSYHFIFGVNGINTFCGYTHWICHTPSLFKVILLCCVAEMNIILQINNMLKINLSLYPEQVAFLGIIMKGKIFKNNAKPLIFS